MRQSNVQVEETFMLQSQVLMDMIELGCADDNIPLQDVTADILAMYCKKHVVDANNKKEFDVDESLKKWDADFVDVDLRTLYDLIYVANFWTLGLLDLAAQKFADIIKYKSISEIRKIFHIQNDLTPAEEEEIRTTNPWAFGN
ncbi:LOW QUALITY PROTEIN: hypothetical protein AQUCO_00700896v1 [Aquilegia coerulea]|uniref:SKP1-like protein n=1 Tax=Aquilegia coerulea TaxID=218851 RepID=A0A2G5EM65_AQUCA|nr:LOW QUALITY PROTEIN: hypothetical protein AQUCO_00700896v1 [Aquilegia coerulea]